MLTGTFYILAAKGLGYIGRMIEDDNSDAPKLVQAPDYAEHFARQGEALHYFNREQIATKFPGKWAIITFEVHYKETGEKRCN